MKNKYPFEVKSLQERVQEVNEALKREGEMTLGRRNRR